VPKIKEQTDADFAVFVDDINARIQREYTGQPLVFDTTSPWTLGYATQSMSKNWFFAMGGFSYAYGAEVIVTPPLGPVETQPKVQIRYQLHTYDYYNWDQGKAVNIGFIHITDRMVGRLHKVGLAQEYELIGITPVQLMDYTYTGPTDSDPSDPALSEANPANRNDGWSDPGRSRNSRTGEREQERRESAKK
ncbi:MAG TPA: hypothetical protein VK364_00190, partial [Hymenobacter sp.]|nr:hypothetical protein [Hymenobacter sp.]